MCGECTSVRRRSGESTSSFLKGTEEDPAASSCMVADTELVRHPCSELAMRPLRVPGGDWLAQGESKHVPKL